MKHINIIALIMSIALIYGCEPENQNPPSPEDPLKDYIVLTQAKGSVPRFAFLTVDYSQNSTHFGWEFYAVDSDGYKYCLNTSLFLAGISPELYGTYVIKAIHSKDHLALGVQLLKYAEETLHEYILFGTFSVLEHHDDYYEIEYKLVSETNHNKYYFLYKGNITTEHIDYE